MTHRTDLLLRTAGKHTETFYYLVSQYLQIYDTTNKVLKRLSAIPLKVRLHSTRTAYLKCVS